MTRAIAIYVDMASFVINELKQIGIEATLKQIETAQWHAMATRGDYQIGANLTGIGPDDPDANFYENYACGSPRNYTSYCNEEVDEADRPAVAGARSQEAAGAGVARSRRSSRTTRRGPSWTGGSTTSPHWPHVKNMVPHQSIYNFGRMQEVWLDK